MATTFKIEVAAPPEQVFDYLADVLRHPEWANPKAKMAAEQTTGQGPGQGATYRTRALFVNKPVSADVQVTAFERPSRFAIRSDQHQEG
jgi:Polyketide cyclase / dehydrase and lipid transport.